MSISGDQQAFPPPTSGLPEEVRPETVALIHDRLHTALLQVGKVIVGQTQLLERVMIALLSGGHLLIEGVPGLAKTRTVRVFSEVLGGSWQRVQFTPDLVPSDLLGTRVWLPGEGRFTTETGPVFANFLLADEINRAPAKVQSALLQAMEERTVTIGRSSFTLPDPFLVLATQNPLESEGTYPLPDAQTDRFMLRVVLDYPSPEEELEVLRRHIGGTPEPAAVLDVETILQARTIAGAVHVPQQIAADVVTLVGLTRPGTVPAELRDLIRAGAGPRASIALLRTAQSRALLHGRTEVQRGDIADLALDVLAHRLDLTYDAVLAGLSQRDVARRLLEHSGILA